MRAKHVFSVLSAVALAAIGLCQSTLTIGDAAPAFNPEGWVKGEPVKKFEKGRVYVVEFWATWCGPCIASFPHLSDMADKYRGQVDFISVNTWDRNEGTEKTAGDKSHVDRVAKFVKENDSKMRYLICLDDEKDTISTTWMRAAGRNGIPCAFIVDQEGTIAWIGHPMSMDEPLAAVQAKKWDKAGFKKQFDEQAAKARAEAQMDKDMVAAAKEGNKAKFDELSKKLAGPEPNRISRSISNALRGSADFAFGYIEQNIGKVNGIDPYAWCSFLSAVTKGTKDDSIKTKAIDVSAMCVEKSPAGAKVLAYGYHAQVLNNAGKKAEALENIKKAEASIAAYEPATGKESVTKWIANLKAMIEKS